MAKIKITALGNFNKRNYFIIDKNSLFFIVFPRFLEELQLDKTGVLYEYSEEPFDINDKIDIIENTKNQIYDLDLFYGKERIIIVIRTDEKNRMDLLKKIKQFFIYPGF